MIVEVQALILNSLRVVAASIFLILGYLEIACLMLWISLLNLVVKLGRSSVLA